MTCVSVHTRANTLDIDKVGLRQSFGFLEFHVNVLTAIGKSNETRAVVQSGSALRSTQRGARNGGLHNYLFYYLLNYLP